MKRSLFALSLGTLALGIAEFVMMAILPYVATDLHISIATAGHLISAYALGVCAGAPALVLTRKFQLKNTLLCLVALIVVGNSLAAISPNYATMMIARFISGLPHGAYFGVGSIIASKLAKEGKSTEAISIMVAGMTIANLLGVPLGTSLSSLLSWRGVFGSVGIGGLAVLFYIWRWVPQVEKLPNNGFKGQFRFLKSGAPWLIIAGTMLGNGGIFCWYSYIHPLLTDVAGFSEASITLLMILAGLGMVCGTLVGGRLSSRFAPGLVAALTQGCAALILLSIFFLAPYPLPMVLLMCLCTMALFAVSSPQQFLVIRYSQGGELLGAASIQVAFNLGNALGAYCGGLPLEMGLGYTYPALIGAPITFGGFLALYLFHRRYEQKNNR